MGEWPNWMGDLPTWITTVAVVLAVAQFLAERKRRRVIEERERKEQARQLTAWVVTDPRENDRKYGVVISNTSGSTFHDIACRVTMHGETVDTDLTLLTLPPGTYFVPHDPTSTYRWEFADLASDYGGILRPYMKTPKYQIDSIAFSDNLENRWSIDNRAVLTLIDYARSR